MHADEGKKKIGIMGGTFDPIHNGHLQIAACAKREYQLSELWFIPAGDPYFKAGKQVTAPAVRLRMTELAVSPHPDFSCSDIELRRSGPTYTSETLAALQALYPSYSFYFIIGADSLFQLESWHAPEQLFRSAVILCAGRPEESTQADDKAHGKFNGKFDEKPDIKLDRKFEEKLDVKLDRKFEEKLDAEITRLNTKYSTADCDIRKLHCRPVNISSTMIRKAVSEGRDISKFVPEPVAAYISEHGLYQ